MLVNLFFVLGWGHLLTNENFGNWPGIGIEEALDQYNLWGISTAMTFDRVSVFLSLFSVDFWGEICSYLPCT